MGDHDGFGHELVVLLLVVDLDRFTWLELVRRCRLGLAPHMVVLNEPGVRVPGKNLGLFRFAFLDGQLLLRSVNTLDFAVILHGFVLILGESRRSDEADGQQRSGGDFPEVSSSFHNYFPFSFGAGPEDQLLKVLEPRPCQRPLA